jgi:hypothetical protein
MQKQSEVHAGDRIEVSLTMLMLGSVGRPYAPRAAPSNSTKGSDGTQIALFEAGVVNDIGRPDGAPH